MSIALESTSNSMRGIKYPHGGIACLATAAIFDSPADRTVVDAQHDAAEVNECSSSAASSTSSSIGKNSDLSERDSYDGEICDDENEVQSVYKGTLDAMDSLEEALPLRRGISKFYNGKSKSYTSLVEASSSSSIKDIGKPENAYTRKRRNLLAFNHIWEKNRSFPYGGGGGISKRPISSSKSTLALAVAMSSSDSISSASEDSSSSSISRSPPHLPPLHPRSRTSHSNLHSLPSFSPWRSFSVADLQNCAAAAATPTSFDKADN